MKADMKDTFDYVMGTLDNLIGEISALGLDAEGEYRLMLRRLSMKLEDEWNDLSDADVEEDE